MLMVAFVGNSDVDTVKMVEFANAGIEGLYSSLRLPCYLFMLRAAHNCRANRGYLETGIVDTVY